MNIWVIVLGTIGFFGCLILMEFTNLGVRGIQQYDPGFSLLDMRLRYDANTIYQVFDQIGEQGQKSYKHYLLLDYCFIACFLIVMLTLSFRVTADPLQRNILIVMAIARALCDILENTLLIVLINNYPQQNMLLATVCSWATTIKFVFMFLWMGMLILAGIINFCK
ncbi:hypothetical protein [Acetobacterium sp.]|uniref:hypothetical protein n=1 Tax=Acetobacterium sp. TaxID=1872094 RepID=UPI000CB78CA2|nr:hypothetical protein [Acetobacterium sp.]MDO9493003.1 hypothetical protein [Acetobacterium sp.]PKM71392.1 MAG: hypothetical protein CVU92_08705 [Firmicutes bacterium HGW-Firmicutes-17]